MKVCKRGPFFNKRHTKGLPFLSKWKSKVLDLGAELTLYTLERSPNYRGLIFRIWPLALFTQPRSQGVSLT